jgi:hypothetical protein
VPGSVRVDRFRISVSWVRVCHLVLSFQLLRAARGMFNPVRVASRVAEIGGMLPVSRVLRPICRGACTDRHRSPVIPLRNDLAWKLRDIGVDRCTLSKWQLVVLVGGSLDWFIVLRFRHLVDRRPETDSDIELLALCISLLEPLLHRLIERSM